MFSPCSPSSCSSSSFSTSTEKDPSPLIPIHISYGCKKNSILEDHSITTTLFISGSNPFELSFLISEHLGFKNINRTFIICDSQGQIIDLNLLKKEQKSIYLEPHTRLVIKFIHRGEKEFLFECWCNLLKEQEEEQEERSYPILTCAEQTLLGRLKEWNIIYENLQELAYVYIKRKEEEEEIIPSNNTPIPSTTTTHLNPDTVFFTGEIYKTEKNFVLSSSSPLKYPQKRYIYVTWPDKRKEEIEIHDLAEMCKLPISSIESKLYMDSYWVCSFLF